MRRYIPILLLALAATAALAQSKKSSTTKDFGLGIILGEPTGLHGKLWLTNNTAVDFAAAWSFEHYSSLHLHADHLWHFRNQFRDHNWSVYVGIGGRLKVKETEDSRLGVRIPVGLVYEIPKSPVDVFMEVAPIMELVPATELNFNAGIGMHYYFH